VRTEPDGRNARQPYSVFQKPFSVGTCPLGCQPDTCPIAEGVLSHFNFQQELLSFIDQAGSPTLVDSSNSALSSTETSLANSETSDITTPQTDLPEVSYQASVLSPSYSTQSSGVGDGSQALPLLRPDGALEGLSSNRLLCHKCPNRSFTRECDLRYPTLKLRPCLCQIGVCC
jgi:hypothetical protein